MTGRKRESEELDTSFEEEDVQARQRTRDGFLPYTLVAGGCPGLPSDAGGSAGNCRVIFAGTSLAFQEYHRGVIVPAVAFREGLGIVQERLHGIGQGRIC